MAETLFRQWFVEGADEGWEEGCLGDVASFHNGKKRPDDIIEGNIPIYGGNGILGYADKSNYEGVTVIIGRVGAYCGSLYIERNPVWISDNALVAKPINKEHSSFLFFLLKSLQLNEMAEGSSHPLLTQTLLKSIQIILPPEHLIKTFVYQADTWLNKSDKNNKQIRILEKLRNTLLPKLMSGEVRVEMEASS
jgi:type I restriction enzyme S subunit